MVSVAMAATLLLLLLSAPISHGNELAKHRAATVEKKPIRIAFMTSLTGPAADDCQDMLNGIELYLDEIHHQMAGRPVELVQLNDQSSVTQGMDRFEEVAKANKADVVAGIFFAHVALHVAPLADQYKIPLVLSVAAADDLTQRTRNEWVIRTSR